MLFKSNYSKLLIVSLALAASQAYFSAQRAYAQEPAPEPLTITPGAAPAEAPAEAPGGQVFTDSEGTWERVPVSAMFTAGPHGSEPSGVRVGRGSVIPDYVETAPFRNVSIHRLYPGAHYDYFVSPDYKVVVLDPSSRHVMRVISHP